MKLKITDEEQTAEDFFTDRIPIEELRTIWNDETITYTDKELFRIREWLYTISEVIINTVRRKKLQNISLNTANHETAQSNSLRSREHRRPEQRV